MRLCTAQAPQQIPRLIWHGGNFIQSKFPSVTDSCKIKDRKETCQHSYADIPVHSEKKIKSLHGEKVLEIRKWEMVTLFKESHHQFLPKERTCWANNLKYEQNK